MEGHNPASSWARTESWPPVDIDDIDISLCVLVHVHYNYSTHYQTLSMY